MLTDRRKFLSEATALAAGVVLLGRRPAFGPAMPNDLVCGVPLRTWARSRAGDLLDVVEGPEFHVMHVIRPPNIYYDGQRWNFADAHIEHDCWICFREWVRRNPDQILWSTLNDTSIGDVPC